MPYMGGMGPGGMRPEGMSPGMGQPGGMPPGGISEEQIKKMQDNMKKQIEEMRKKYGK
jgi:hypothetical protein